MIGPVGLFTETVSTVTASGRIGVRAQSQYATLRASAAVRYAGAS